jgi:hypothetical protein
MNDLLSIASIIVSASALVSLGVAFITVFKGRDLEQSVNKLKSDIKNIQEFEEIRMRNISDSYYYAARSGMEGLLLIHLYMPETDLFKEVSSMARNAIYRIDLEHESYDSLKQVIEAAYKFRKSDFAYLPKIIANSNRLNKEQRDELLEIHGDLSKGIHNSI